jgi:iron(II)-dependent oxidoreductase
MPVAGLSASIRRTFAELLAEARARTLLLITPLAEPQLRAQPDPALPPILDQLERIVRFEQRWLLDETGGGSIATYDEWFDIMMETRQRVLDRLELTDVTGNQDLAGERYRMVLEHEYGQDEAILENLQAQPDRYNPIQQRDLPPGRRLADPGFMVRFPGGIVEIGATERLSVWREEQPMHRVELRPFWIDVLPVTNGDFLSFMAASGARAPRHWVWRDGSWWTRWMGHEASLDLGSPVAQVSHSEAEAFAHFVGKRLPTEQEWEAAAGWDPETQSRRDYPWGNMPPSSHVANLDQLALRPAPVGAFPGNRSPVGCYGMIGDLWEWTTSEFLPGEDAKVLRGGSWATRTGAVRITTRRPAAPESRHLFTGFRCARDD